MALGAGSHPLCACIHAQASAVSVALSLPEKEENRGGGNRQKHSEEDEKEEMMKGGRGREK